MSTPGDAAFEYVLRGHQIGGDVAGQGVFAAVRVSHGFHLLVRDRGKSQLTEDSLHGFSGFAADADHFLLRNRTETAVNLHISLQYIVIVKIFRIKVRTREHVVVVRLCGISRENEIRTRQKLQHRARSPAHIGIGEALVVGRSAFQS